jgi:RNA polymerase sigma-70 factor (ECF subfamily)
MTDLSATELLEGAEPPRRELLVFCYLMLGSVHEAVTTARVVSERVGVRGEGPPLESYAEAVTACVARASTRRLPTGIGAASAHPEGDLDRRTDVLWLEPMPDSLLEGVRGRVDLEHVAALQLVPAGERAELILRDYGNFDDAAVAEDQPSLQQELLGRWAAAFEAYDVDAITGMLSDDAVWEMPPFAAWFRGARSIGKLIRTWCPAQAAGDQVMVPIRANHQPAFALYMLDPHTGAHRAFQIQVLTLTAVGVVHTVAFFDLSLFEAFGLPQLLSDLNSSQPTPTDPVDGAVREQRKAPAAAQSRVARP